MTDDTIGENIRSELWWSPWVESDEIAVTVEDGVATLTGLVDSQSEEESAVENALEGGARNVINELRIDSTP